MTTVTTRVPLILVMGIVVAVNAVKEYEIPGCGMAINALIPFIFMLSGVNREILLIVVVVHRIPGILRMTISAIRWELLVGVIRVAGALVIRSVATVTGVWRVVVIAVVALRTIICNRDMRSVQHVIVIVNREGCRRPVWIGGVTHRTIRMNVDRLVIRL